MKDLQKFNVTELSDDSIKATEGGILLTLAVALTAMGIHDAIDHPDAFWDGLTGAEL